jgi:hypothetical protein
MARLSSTGRREGLVRGAGRRLRRGRSRALRRKSRQNTLDIGLWLGHGWRAFCYVRPRGEKLRQSTRQRRVVPRSEVYTGAREEAHEIALLHCDEHETSRVEVIGSGIAAVSSESRGRL